MKALAKKLESHPVIGPGLVHRCAADLQRTFLVTGHIETALTLSRGRRPAERLDDRRALAPSTPNRPVRKR
jgi:hypothetical protein